MTIPQNFNPHGVVRIKPLDEHATLVSYADGKPSTVIQATPSEIERFITEAKSRADSDPEHTGPMAPGAGGV